MPSGGRRPGAGPHSTKDVIYYDSKKVWVRERIEPDFAAMVDAQIQLALKGNLDSFKHLCQWAGVILPPHTLTLIDNSTTINSPVSWDHLPWQDPVWLAQRAQRILNEASRLHLIDGSSRPLDDTPPALPPDIEP